MKRLDCDILHGLKIGDFQRLDKAKTLSNMSGNTILLPSAKLQQICRISSKRPKYVAVKKNKGLPEVE